MKRIFTLILSLGLFTNSFSQSDDCSTATSVTSGTTCSSPVVGTTAGATQSMPGCSGTADDDVWYKFTATAASHSLAVTGSSNFSPVFEVFSGSCGSLVSLVCNDDASYGQTGATHLLGLTPGNVYYFRVYHYYSGSGSGTFTVCLTEGVAPVNDDCLNAIAITSSVVCTPVAGTSAWASQSMSGCTGNADDDVWYKFTATSVSHSLAVTGSSNYSPVFEVFSGSCGSLTSLDCNDNAFSGGTGSSHLSNLTPGNVYYFRVYNYYAGSGSDTFTICLTEGTPPVNDDCNNAIAITSSSGACNPVVGTSEWASSSLADCAGNADDEVWYKFTATAVSHSLAVIGSSNYSPAFEVFSGSCGSLTSIDCNSSASTAGTGSSHLTGLTIGATYYFRVYHYYAGSGSNTFTICLTDAPAPVNDDCSGAITVTASAVCTSPLIGTSGFANESMPGCAGFADDDVWYKFTAATASYSLEVQGSSAYDAVVEIFSGSSCGSLTSLSCNDNGGTGGVEQIHLGSLTIGATYYFRVYHYSFGSASSTFSICLTTAAQQPTNDDCSGATTVAVTPNCNTSPVVVNSFGATQSMSGCTGTPDDDVWCSFVATNANQNIEVTGDVTADAVVQLLGGTCGLLIPLECIDNSGMGQTETIYASGLTVGQTYYVRLYDYYANGGKTFTISVITREISASSSAAAVCLGHSVTLSATGTPTLSWSNGVSNGVAFTPTVTNTYTVSGTGTGGCVNTATVDVVVATPQMPEICMVTVDTLNVNNVIYWEKANYNNIDSMIIHREVVANTYQRIGAVDDLAFSRFIDTARHTGFRNGDPNIRSYRYKLQIRDTCGNYSALSLYHTSLFLNNTGSTFNWNFYDIETQTSPVVNYELYRDDFNSGAFNLIGTVQSTLGVSTYSLTDPNYATFAGTARWGVTADGFACNPSFRTANPSNPMTTVYKSKANVKNNFTIPDPPPDPDPQAVHELNLDAYIRLMPNPAQDVITINSAFALQRVAIYNSLGALVQQAVLTKEISSSIDVHSLSNGMYSVEIVSEKGRIVKKLLIHK